MDLGRKWQAQAMSGQPHHLDPEAPEADVLEQEQEIGPEDVDERPEIMHRRDPEVPEADALEQAIDVPYDDEYET